jgi:hypothetical protein
MAYVLFIPGLSGHKFSAETKNFQSSIDYLAVKKAAEFSSVPCIRADFQISANIFPLQGMEKAIASKISEMQKHHGDPGLIVTSSVSAGTTMKALSELSPDIDLPHVIACRPILDPALRLVGRPHLLARFEEKLGERKLPSLLIVASGENSVTLPEKAHEFANIIKNYVEDGCMLISIAGPCESRYAQLQEAVQDRLSLTAFKSHNSRAAAVR